MLCSDCNKNLAVIFMTKMENNKQTTKGLCFECAKKRGIDPLNNMLLQQGMSQEELESLTSEMEDFISNLSQENEDSNSMVADEKSILGAFAKMFGGPEGDQTSNDSTTKVKVQDKKSTKKRKLLDTYGINLTDLAREGKLDKIAGRNNEINRTIQILNRRTKNNPVLIGEPGVGKTAIAEALAMRIVDKKVPPKLFNHEVYQLDITAVVAGTQFRGQFESRMRGIIDEAKNSGNIILVIDELHMITGAGDAEGAMNAANILKPALSRGEIQVIGAATLKEYRKHIEKDSALERRLQPVMVDEPTAEETLEILKTIKPYYEDFHKVSLPVETLEAAVSMSKRYIHDRFLPDKAIDLIDEASSRINLNNKPLAKLEILKAQLRGIQEEKESAVSADSIEDYQKAADLKTKECNLTNEIEALEKKIKKAIVTEEDLAEVIESWTKIPAKKITETESEKLLNLETALHKRIIGQENAVSTLSNAIRRHRAGLRNRKRPPSFIFVGPTGVGKTELVKALACELFCNEESIIRLDMSEFMEKHAVSKLIGAPPGYVGYDDAGQLTEKVRRNPYSIILFDEIEKAAKPNPRILDIFLQILEDGRLTDSKGETVYFSESVIIFTSNLGASEVSSSGSNEEIAKEFIKIVKNYFDNEIKRPEILGRIGYSNIVPFNFIKDKEFSIKIAKSKLRPVQKAILEKYRIDLEFEDELRFIDYILGGADSSKGGRDILNAINDKLLDELAMFMFENKQDLSSLKGSKILVKTAKNGLEFSFEND